MCGCSFLPFLVQLPAIERKIHPSKCNRTPLFMVGNVLLVNLHDLELNLDLNIDIQCPVFNRLHRLDQVIKRRD